MKARETFNQKSENILQFEVCKNLWDFSVQSDKNSGTQQTGHIGGS